jgi:hypothetical protein
VKVALKTALWKDKQQEKGRQQFMSKKIEFWLRFCAFDEDIKLNRQDYKPTSTNVELANLIDCPRRANRTPFEHQIPSAAKQKLHSPVQDIQAELLLHVGRTSLCGGSVPSSIFGVKVPPLEADVAGSSFGIFFNACIVVAPPLAACCGVFDPSSSVGDLCVGEFDAFSL